MDMGILTCVRDYDFVTAHSNVAIIVVVILTSFKFKMVFEFWISHMCNLCSIQTLRT